MNKIELGFDLHHGGHRRELRKYLVELLNVAQDRFEFGVFQTNATNYHENGCLYVIWKGDHAKTRNDDSVLMFWEYQASAPSKFADKYSKFDIAYVEARVFIRDNCRI